MYYLRYLSLFAHSGVQHICVVILFVCIRLVYSMLSFSLDFVFCIAPSVFSNVYLLFFSDNDNCRISKISQTFASSTCTTKNRTIR
jgi:hypothetical protein